jgi:hypothetical protein
MVRLENKPKVGADEHLSPTVVVSCQCGYTLTVVETDEYHMWMIAP